MRLLVAAGLFTFAGFVVSGCSPPQPTTNATFTLKPLPPPGSPADGAGKAKQPRGERSKSTNPDREP